MAEFRIVAKETQSRYGIWRNAASLLMRLKIIIIRRMLVQSSTISTSASPRRLNLKNKKLQKKLNVNCMVKINKALVLFCPICDLQMVNNETPINR